MTSSLSNGGDERRWASGYHGDMWKIRVLKVTSLVWELTYDDVTVNCYAYCGGESCYKYCDVHPSYKQIDFVITAHDCKEYVVYKIKNLVLKFNDFVYNVYY